MRQAEDTMPYKSRMCIFMSGCAIYVDVYLQYNVQLIAQGWLFWAVKMAGLGSLDGLWAITPPHNAVPCDKLHKTIHAPYFLSW